MHSLPYSKTLGNRSIMKNKQRSILNLTIRLLIEKNKDYCLDQSLPWRFCYLLLSCTSLQGFGFLRLKKRRSNSESHPTKRQNGNYSKFAPFFKFQITIIVLINNLLLKYDRSKTRRNSGARSANWFVKRRSSIISALLKITMSIIARPPMSLESIRLQIG